MPVTALVTLVSQTAYSQSHQHDEPFLEKESHDAYDLRTWRSKMNTATREDGTRTVVIPAHGMQQAIAASARYAAIKIPGKGAATWTKKFVAGIALVADIDLNVDPATVDFVTISANADGVRGSGKRVRRRFPIIPKWSATFEVVILDPIITEDIFREVMDGAGMFIGVGRFRPEKGGINGRFSVQHIEWRDDRRLAA